MLMITSVDGHSLSAIGEETNEKLQKTIEDCVLETENNVSFLALYAKSGSYAYKTCSLMWGSLFDQRLWQTYLNFKLTLEQVQTEAVHRGIAIDGKTQEQLAAEIIAYECQQHGTAFLL
jgi:predicted oxidoreductase